MQKIGNLLKGWKQKTSKLENPAHYFQERALLAITELGIDVEYKGAIMGAFRNKNDKAEAVWKYMKDLKKKKSNPATYFLWLMAKKEGGEK